MDEYLNHTYKIIPQLQKRVSFQNEKLKTFDEFITQYGEKIDELEEFEKKLEEINRRTEDLNMADILKENVPDIEGEEGKNKLVLNLISKMENNFNGKIKAIEDRLNKLELSNFKILKDIQNIKNVQDLNKRNISSLKQSNENIITNLKSMENRIAKIGPELEHKIEAEKITNKKKEEIDETPKKEENEKKERESLLDISRKSEPQIDLENNEKIKEIISRISDVEVAVKIIPNQIGVEQIKLDISALKSAIRNFALSSDLKESKDKEEDIQKQLNFLKEQFEDFVSNTADHEDLQNVKRKMELLNSKVHDLEENYQIVDNKLNIHNKNKTSVISNEKYLETQIFENFRAQIIKEFSSVNDNFTHIRRLVDNILDSLKNKPAYKDIKALEEEIMLKYEELKVASNKKFAERIETTKNFKYLDTQIKNILQIYIKREKRSENWLLAKKPITNLCASCEAYIGELRDNNSYQPWNKYPMKDPNDKVYRLGNGFSKMLQMITSDENDIKNQGMITQQNNPEFNLGNKLLKLDKVESNLNNEVNLGPIKTENNNTNNNYKSLPKIKGNNTMTNFTKKNNNNLTVENIGRNKQGNNFVKDIETNEQIDMNDFSYDEEEKRPKIIKITKLNKE